MVGICLLILEAGRHIEWAKDDNKGRWHHVKTKKKYIWLFVVCILRITQFKEFHGINL